MHAAFNASVPLTWGLDPTWVWQARAVILTVLAVALTIATWYVRPTRNSMGPRHRVHAHDQ